MNYESSTPSHTEVERRVLSVLKELVGELRGDDREPRIRLQDSLEQDLGISSLERVELLIRLEQVCNIRLDDSVMIEASSAADLVSAIAEGQHTFQEQQTSHIADTITSTPAPTSARTIVEALVWHAERTPDRAHIYLREDDGNETQLTYGWLWAQAQAIAGGLCSRGVKRGDTVAMLLRTEADFFATFMGILIAGGIPVPLYPPARANRIEEYVIRQVNILKNAGAQILITFEEVERVASLLVNQVQDLHTVVKPETLISSKKSPVLTTGSDGALIQYTSGSTGLPKGVFLTHENLLANIRAIVTTLKIDSNDVGVSWLPLYHDMGLIGTWLGTFYVGAPVALMSPLAFLARPVRWLQSISSRGGTVSAAPNFAYDLCATRVTDEELEELDLSSARLLLNGSEAVSPTTIKRFIERFTPCGLPESAVFPVYGLAECSVGLSAPMVGSLPRFDAIRRNTFQETGEAIPTQTEDANTFRFVSCGKALPGHELIVVDDDGHPVEERHRGNIKFRGPSATSGYYRNPEATRKLIDVDGWLKTGDLGYIADGELFLTGRSKDVIIKGGRNLYPEEAELVTGQVSGVRTGCVAAFGISDNRRGTEQFVVVAETRLTSSEEQESVKRAIIRAVGNAVGVAPDQVVLTPPGTVPKTSSGKIRRSETRNALLSGQLGTRPASTATQWTKLLLWTAITRVKQWSTQLGKALYTCYVVGLMLVSSPLILPLLFMGPRGPWIDRVVGFWNRVLLLLTACPVTIVGREKVPTDKPVVFVANHASYLDPPLMMGVLPQTARFATKGKLADYPILGTAIRKGGHIPINKINQSQRIEGLTDIRQLLNQGESIFVFPEGTFELAPRLLPFRLGAFHAAVDAGCPVIPVAIRGTRNVFPALSRLLKPGRITVTFGAPLHAKNSDWSEIVRLRNEALSFISSNCGES